jgi:NADH dehydrogenase
MDNQLVTVFGGTGFLGRQVVRQLAHSGFHVRIAARQPKAVAFPNIESQVEAVSVDVRDEENVSSALNGATAAVNAVSLYVEHSDLSFDAIHVEGAGRVARLCRESGVSSLVHVSGIGSDSNSPSSLIRAKGRGEQAVSGQFAPATIFRPSVMFGRNDAFLSAIERATRAPVVPLFGRGDMRQQPAFVKDVANAAVSAIQSGKVQGEIIELGGARILTYREAVEAVCDHLGRKRLLFPFPFALWKPLVRAISILPEPPLTIDQLCLLVNDNTVGSGSRTFADLDIEPRSMTDLLDYCLEKD